MQMNVSVSSAGPVALLFVLTGGGIFKGSQLPLKVSQKHLRKSCLEPKWKSSKHRDWSPHIYFRIFLNLPLEI